MEGVVVACIGGVRELSLRCGIVLGDDVMVDSML